MTENAMTGDIDAQFEQALIAYQDGDFTAALKRFEQLALVQPDVSVIQLNMGNVHFKQEHLEKAETCWKKAIELDPLESSAYLNLGNLYYKQERLEAAISHWEAFKCIERKHANVWLNLGIAYEKLGDMDEAFEHYSVFLGLAGDSAESRQIRQRFEKARKIFENNVQVAETHLKQGNSAKALEILRNAIALYPGNARIYKTTASLLYQHGDLKDALACYEKVLILTSDDITALTNLGVICEKLQQPGKAIWAYHKAGTLPSPEKDNIRQRYNTLCASHPNAATDLLEQAQGWYRQGKIKQAARWLERLQNLAETPNGIAHSLASDIESWLDKVKNYADPELRASKTFRSKGIDAEEQGRFDQALRFYQRYLELKPKGPQADEIRHRLDRVQHVLNAMVNSILRHD